MVWLFLSVVLVLAVYHEGFRSILGKVVGIACVLLVLLVIKIAVSKLR
jgi:hypothetical protein